jgi:hypothetical protein
MLTKLFHKSIQSILSHSLTIMNMNTIQYPLYISTKYINNHNHTYNNNNYNNNLSLFNRIKYTITT